MQKFLPDYNEVTITHSGNRFCHYCEESIRNHYPYLHLRRSRHIFNICGKCVVLFARKVSDPAASGNHTVSHASNNSRKCHHCGKNIGKGNPFIDLVRNRYRYNICGECLMTFSVKVVSYDDTVKEDVVAELL